MQPLLETRNALGQLTQALYRRPAGHYILLTYDATLQQYSIVHLDPFSEGEYPDEKQALARIRQLLK